MYNSTSTNVSEYDNKQLYPVNLTLEYRNGTGDSSVLLGDNVTFTPTKPGTASVTATIRDTSCTILLTINKEERNTTLTEVSIPEIYQDKDAEITGTLIDNKDNTGLSNQEILINITNNTGYTKNYTTYTDKDGRFNQKIKINITGPITIKITYKGNQTDTTIYNTSNYTQNIEVNKVTYNIIFNPLEKSYNYNSTVTITGTITSNYQLESKILNLTINNEETIPVKIDADGMFKYTIKDITTPGQYKILANYTGTTNTTTFWIKYPTEFTIDNISNITEGDSITLTVTEKNNYTGPVNVTIGSENYTVTLINGSGKTTLTPKLKPGTYNATITFKGDETYNATKATSNNFKINNKPAPTPTPEPTPSKISTKIIAKQKNFKTTTKNKKYTITLKTTDNKIIKKAKVTLKVKGKTYKATTNNKGKAVFKLNKLNKKENTQQ